MSIHPEDTLAYAEQLTSDLNRIGAALERIANALESVIHRGPQYSALEVRGLMITREDRP